MKWFLAILVAFVAVVASAAETAKVYNLPGGSYLITGQVRAVGPVISPVGPVIPDPDDPIPDDVSKLTRDLITALPASDTRHKNAIKLAGTLKLLADQTKERNLSSDAIAKVYSPLMAIAVPDDDWKHIHTAILAGLKGCPSPAVCASSLEAWAAGAMSTVPNKADPKIVRGVGEDEIAAAAEEYGFDWSMLFELLLPILLKLLEQWLSYVSLAAALLC
jgi:hypothetical protein